MQDDEIVKDIKFEGGSLHPDSAAKAALLALPDGDLATKLVALEALYEQLMYVRVGKARFLGRLAWWFAGDLLRIFRQEIALLATAYQELSSNGKAQTARDSFGAEYTRMCAEQAEFQKFLRDNFTPDLERAQSLNVSLLELTKSLLLRNR